MRRSFRVLGVLLVVFIGMTSISSAYGQKVIKFAYEGEWMLEFFKWYTQKNPDIKIEASPISLADIDSGALQLALAGGTGPDIMQIDAAPGRMGMLALAGLLYPLDEFYAKYGWDKKLFPWTLRSVTYNGKKYGLPSEVEYIGPFYNKNIFKKLGLNIPKTYEEFKNLLSKLKSAGYIPVTQGTRDPAPRGHIYANFIEASAGKVRVERLLYGNGRWDSPEFNLGAKELQELVRSDLVYKECNSLKYSESNNLLWTEKAAMTFMGTWILYEYLKEYSKMDFGYFILPPIGKDVPGRFTGGLGSGYAISAKTKYPEECVKILDTLFNTPEGQRMMLTVGKVIPPLPILDFSKVKKDLHPLQIDVIQKLKDPKGIGYNLSVYIPTTVKNVYYENIQGLMGLMISPEECNRNIQKEWERAKAAGLILK